ncbi:MAG: hypothetical protein J5509_10665 [Lachnospiraceae bacterium]|nr:hypothetical protein [Lachnospiraceae bacterium]
MADDTRDDRIQGESGGRADDRDRAGENAEANRDNSQTHIEVDVSRPKTAKEREEEKLLRIAELEEEKRRQKEEEKRRQELYRRRRKRRLITPGFVLVVGAIASITMFLMKFENKRMLIWLLVILLVSWMIGSLIQYMFERFAAENETNVSDEGEVINRGLANSEDVKAEENG